IDCPKEVAETYLEREGQWQLPALTRVISAPTLRADGSVLDEPGYDARTGLLFDPQGAAFPKLAASPTREDAVAAVGVLKELIATGNNLRLVGDMTRRALISFLDPQVERPELREFDVDPIE